MKMSQDLTIKAVVSATLAVIAAPIQFIAITFWLLIGNTVLSVWARLKKLREENEKPTYLQHLEILTDVFWNLLKYMAVLFFLLTAGSALSNFDTNLAWFELATYIAIGVWLFTLIGKNASAILGATGLDDVVRKLGEKLLATQKINS